MGAFEDEVERLREWMGSERFAETTRVHTARQIVEQRGTVPQDYTVARDAAERFYERLRELFAEGKSITTFGPYSPGQAVPMKRAGIEGIYLGGWATSAKGSTTEDPGPDLASYPLSQVPDEAAGLVRALLTADRNQRFARARMTEAEREATARGRLPALHHRRRRHRSRRRRPRAQPHPPVRRGRACPGTTSRTRSPAPRSAGTRAARCSCPRTSRSSASTPPASSSTSWACPGIIVARTDAEAANLLDGCGDERDQPFILGVTNRRCRPTRPPTWRSCGASTRPAWRTSTATCSTRSPRRSTPTPTPGSSAAAWPTAIDEAADDHAAGEGAPAEDTLDLVADTLPGRVAGRCRPAHPRRRGRRADRLPRRRGVGARHDRRGVARVRLPGVLVRHRGPRRRRWAWTWSGTPSWPRPPRATTRSRAASRTPSRSRWRRRRSPTCSGWRPRRRTWPTRRSSPTRSTPSTPTRCWPTTCRRPSTGTPPA